MCVSRGLHNVKHRHFSSAYQRLMCINNGAGTMQCPICQYEHPLGIMCTPRLKTIWCSSTLHNAYQAAAWDGTAGYHVDVESLCGAKIALGSTLWQATYGETPMNIDTHLVFGLNDIIAMVRRDPSDSDTVIQQHVADFMARLQVWYNHTVDHATKHGLESPNRFSVSPVLKAPQLYNHPGNKGQNWPSHNKLIDTINKEISQFNKLIRVAVGDDEEETEAVAGLANLGSRKRNSKSPRAHAGKQWRELQFNRKLHLGPRLQAKALEMCVKHLQFNTPNDEKQFFATN